MSKTTDKALEEKRKGIIKGILEHNEKYGFPTKPKENKDKKK